MSEVSTCWLEYFDNILSLEKVQCTGTPFGEKGHGLLAMFQDKLGIFRYKCHLVCIQNRSSVHCRLEASQEYLVRPCVKNNNPKIYWTIQVIATFHRRYILILKNRFLLNLVSIRLVVWTCYCSSLPPLLPSFHNLIIENLDSQAFLSRLFPETYPTAFLTKLPSKYELTFLSF